MSLPIGKPPTLIRSLDRLDYKVKFMAEMLIEQCRKQGIPIIITQTFRTKETQQEYYSWGRTKINPFKNDMTKVTNLDGVKKISRHQTGLAFDVCINIKGSEYNVDLLTKVGKIGMGLGLTWGGSWKSFPDMPHFEIPPNQINNFKLPIKEGNTMSKFIPITTREIQYGVDAINRLSELGYLTETDRHVKTLQQYPELWSLWVMHVKLAERGEK